MYEIAHSVCLFLDGCQGEGKGNCLIYHVVQVIHQKYAWQIIPINKLQQTEVSAGCVGCVAAGDCSSLEVQFVSHLFFVREKWM